MYYYSNLAGVVGWAKSAADFRKQHGLKGGYAVRVAHAGVAPPAGYVKGERELANYPAVRPTMKRTKGDSVNFYSLGCAILASEMTGFGE